MRVASWFLTRLGGLILLLSGVAGIAAQAAEKQNLKGVEFFERKIRPILVAQCYECHSQDSKELKGGLLVDSREGIRKGGDTGEAIVAGKPQASLLLAALRHDDDPKMPPKGKLADEVIADFEAWIKMGAPDPRDGKAVVKKDIDIDEGRKFWAFQPPKKSAPPPVKNKKWPQSEVDRFILAGLEAKNLKPVSDADHQTLVRRLYFDLIGLPPTPDAIESFVQNGIRNPRSAIQNLVDHLLDSPQFGERWGRHWLDIARFAESNGNVDNNLFPYAWRYRDYVIQSFNNDKPYDQFVTEQVAGDLLDAETPAERNEYLTATGFLALTSKPRAQNNPDFGMDLVADQIEVTTTTILGLTVACARCHDHKFDPVPQKDYYAMAGFFTSSEMLFGVQTQNNKQPTTGSGKVHQLVAESEEEVQKASNYLAEVDKLKTRRAEMVADPAVRRLLTQQRQDAAKPKNKQKPKQVLRQQQKENAERKAADDPQAVDALAEVEKIDKELAALAANDPRTRFAIGVRDGKPNDCALCIRGETQKRGDVIPRGFVSVLPGQLPALEKNVSGRLELARWLASADNPLTARVMVNRIWQHLLGTGIVPTVDNFGQLGELPTNQPLLDYLAVRFVEQGWSIKQVIREVVLSRAYQLSSIHDSQAFEVDPDNRLTWRHSPRRLEAECIRDAILAASGQLDLTPLQGTLIAKHGAEQVRNNLMLEIAKLESNHRSIYLPVVRQATPANLEPFDMADSSLVVGARDVTTVPTQALFFFNSAFVIEQSRQAAKLLLEDKSRDNFARIDAAYQRLLGRHATNAERDRALAFVSHQADNDSSSPEQAWASFCQALFASAEFRYVR